MTALEDVKVLDLTRAVPGPFCTMVLADFGADVLKIQEPASPQGRRAELAQGTSLAYMQRANFLDRNKKSIVINLKSDEGKEVFFKLVKQADVVVEQWRPGVSKRLGIDYDTLKTINKRLIYCAITGYGQTGPYKNRVGHDINYIAYAGALGLIGKRGGDPIIPLNIFGDYAGGGMFAAIGILMALHARERTGEGDYVDAAMADGVIYMLARHYGNYLTGTWEDKRGVNTGSGGGRAYYNVYKTKDNKYITIANTEPWFWVNFCRAIGREDFIPWQQAKGAKQRELFSFLRQMFRTKSRDEWFDILTSNGDMCVGKVNSMSEVLEHPHALAREMFVETDEPQLGKVKQVGVGIKLSKNPGRVKTVAPRKGQHTRETLAELGYSKDQVEGLYQSGSVG